MWHNHWYSMGTALGFSTRICWLSLSWSKDGQDMHVQSTGLCLLRFITVCITNSSCTMIFWLESLQIYRERIILKDLMKLVISPQNFLPQPYSPQTQTLEITIVFQKDYHYYSVGSISHINFLISFIMPMDLFYI